MLIENRKEGRNNKNTEVIIIALMLKQVCCYDSSHQIFRYPCGFPSFLCSGLAMWPILANGLRAEVIWVMTLPKKWWPGVAPPCLLPLPPRPWRPEVLHGVVQDGASVSHECGICVYCVNSELVGGSFVTANSLADQYSHLWRKKKSPVLLTSWSFRDGDNTSGRNGYQLLSLRNTAKPNAGVQSVSPLWLLTCVAITWHCVPK